MTNPTGVKHDQGKPDFSLLPPEALFELAKLYTFGAAKYAPRNWELGMDTDRLFAALQRHAWAWKQGEVLDTETQLHHMASVAFCAFALITYWKRGTVSTATIAQEVIPAETTTAFIPQRF